MLAGYAAGDKQIQGMLNGVLQEAKVSTNALCSVLGRHAARAVECKLVAGKLKEWVLQLQPEQPTFTDFPLEVSNRGMGLHEAPRGALGHWIVVEQGKVKNYQAVVPTTWNAGPIDSKGQPGPRITSYNVCYTKLLRTGGTAAVDAHFSRSPFL